MSLVSRAAEQKRYREFRHLFSQVCLRIDTDTRRDDSRPHRKETGLANLAGFDAEREQQAKHLFFLIQPCQTFCCGSITGMQGDDGVGDVGELSRRFEGGRSVGDGGMLFFRLMGGEQGDHRVFLRCDCCKNFHGPFDTGAGCGNVGGDHR